MAKKPRRDAVKKVIDRFRGRDVVNVAAKVTNVGDGLSQAWELNGDGTPLLNHGDRVTIVVDAVVVDIDTKPDDPKDLLGDLKYVYNFRGETVAIAETPQNRRLLDRQRDAIARSYEIPGQGSINDELPEGKNDGD